MPERGFIAGLLEAASIAKELGAMAKKCGQDTVDPEVHAEATARAIKARADQEDTPPGGVKMCQCCGSPIPG